MGTAATDHWLERWASGNTPWHLEAVNPWLAAHWAQLRVPAGAGVFVPLCGASVDMAWLHGRGHAVLGVDLAEQALQAFCSGAGVAVTRHASGPFTEMSAPGYRLLAGDLFDLRPADLAGVRAVFDRAALVALPPAERQRCAALYASHLPVPVDVLLVTLEHAEGSKDGPPHHVPADEVEALFLPHGFHIRELAVGADEPAPPPMRAQGLARLRERVFHLARR